MRRFFQFAFVRRLCTEHRAAAVSLLLALGTLALYWPVHRHEFNSYDDEPYVTDNPLIIQGMTVHGIVRAFTGNHFFMWHPLTTLSHMLDCELFGLEPEGHHLVSVFLHSASTALLFILLNGLTKAFWPSAVVAALFAWHPLRVESVAWVAERKDVLSTLFWMLTLAAYVRYAQRPTRLRYSLVLVSFGLGIMTKPMIVTLPFVLLLLDIWPLGRFHPFRSGNDRGKASGRNGLSRFRALVLEKMPLLALSGFLSIMTFLAQQKGGIVVTLEKSPFLERLGTAAMSYLFYVEKMFVPMDLAVFYPIPHSWPWWQLSAAGLLLVAGTFFAIQTLKRHPYIFVGWFWYLGVLVPTIGLVRVSDQAFADRYTYIPLIGLFIVIVWGVRELLGNWRLRREASALLTTAALIGCLLLTRRQLTYWQNATTLFAHAVKVTQNNSLAHNNLGAALFKEGKTDEAIHQYRQALRISPGDFNARLNLANSLATTGNNSEAIPEYLDALRINARSAKAHTGFGVALAQAGRTNEAVEQYQQALQFDPNLFEAHYDLGKLLASQRMLREASEQFEKAIQCQPKNAIARNEFGLALMELGRHDDAIGQFRISLKIDKDNFDAHCDLGVAFFRQGNFAGAIEEFSQALKIRQNAATYVNLGNVLATSGRAEEAINQYRQALRCDSTSSDAHNFLGVALFRQGNNEEAVLHYEEALRLKPDHTGAHYNAGKIRLLQRNYSEAIKHFAACIRLNGRDSDAHYQLGLTFAADYNTGKAIEEFREALRLRPDFPAALHSLGWILATHEDPAFRSGSDALRLATRAVELSRPPTPEILSGLAAAQAEVGNFKEAVTTAQTAAELAISLNRPELTRELSQRLASYRKRIPYRDPTLSVRPNDRN